MKIRHCAVERCGRPFQVNEFRSTSVLNTYRGRITCPHCGTLELLAEDTIYLTHALSIEEELRYQMQKFPRELKQA